MVYYSPGVQDPDPSLAAADEQVHVRRGPRRSRELPAAGDQEIPNRSRSDAPDPTRRSRHHDPSPRVSPYTVHVGFQNPLEIRQGGERGRKLYISNLAYSVSDEDIRTLFSEIGHLQNFGVHYDRTGRSMGTGEVVFFRHSDAMAAMRTYNNVPLDGRPIKIAEVGVHVEIAPVPLPGLFQGSLPITPFQFVPPSIPPNLSGYEEGESSRLPRAGGSGSRAQDPQFKPHGHEGWRDRSHHRHVTNAELDADLDRYRSDAKRKD
ncbi:PREDICTED: THO complex subunit 4A-like [Ipomoea nil]|uniref:THO complex subunit 4A-like n=1 Tax=Ipomoea nil TaxID=35883 RepID=UPI000900D934|nr:PREDICTED: THO complex subunit 4A-like [Ipomoea nil]